MPMSLLTGFMTRDDTNPLTYITSGMVAMNFWDWKEWPCQIYTQKKTTELDVVQASRVCFSLPTLGSIRELVKYMEI